MELFACIHETFCLRTTHSTLCRFAVFPHGVCTLCLMLPGRVSEPVNFSLPGFRGTAPPRPQPASSAALSMAAVAMGRPPAQAPPPPEHHTTMGVRTEESVQRQSAKDRVIVCGSAPRLTQVNMAHQSLPPVRACAWDVCGRFAILHACAVLTGCIRTYV